jgi:hypothetical protein
MSSKARKLAKRLFMQLPYSGTAQLLSALPLIRAELQQHPYAVRIESRFAMYAWLAERLSGKAVRYLEFGVWEGESIREWARIVPSAESSFVRYRVVALERHPALQVTDDKAAITLEFADGSVGTIHYLANGDKGFPKERLEVFCAGKVLQLDNFRRLRGWGWQGFSKMHLWRQNKGHAACVGAFVDAVKQGQPAPIPLDEILEVSRVSIELQNALRA